MNASPIKARTVVTNESAVARADTPGGQLLLPASGGIALAVAFHIAATALGAESGIRFLAALAGVSGWLYVGAGFQAQRLRAVVAGLAAAAGLFAGALLAVHHTPSLVGALFLAQAAVGVIAAAMFPRSNPLIAWVSLNAVLGILTMS